MYGDKFAVYLWRHALSYIISVATVVAVQVLESLTTIFIAVYAFEKNPLAPNLLPSELHRFVPSLAAVAASASPIVVVATSSPSAVIAASSPADIADPRLLRPPPPNWLTLLQSHLFPFPLVDSFYSPSFFFFTFFLIKEKQCEVF